MGVIFFFFGEGYKGWQDMFRRCSSNQEEQAAPLLTPQRDSQGSDGVLSDNDSDTDVSSGSIQGKPIKITREKV